MMKPIIRPAGLEDVLSVLKLMNPFIEQDILLPKTKQDMEKDILNFGVCEQEGQIVGCASLKMWGENVAEIRSLAVVKQYQGQGIGRALVEFQVTKARALGVGRIFVLTYEQAFFESIGFVVVNRDLLPEKIWGDCVSCRKFYDCHEIAMIYKDKETHHA